MTDYRTIDLTGMQPVEPASQPAPQLMWIEIADLVIDDRYQRPLAEGNRAAIRRIAGDFHWSRFSPVLVAPVEGGKYALIDGQHRAHAAALCGYDRIPAMVALVAPEEQAIAFIEINTRQIKVRGVTIYRAALSAGEPWAIECRDRVEAAGCQLMTANWSQAKKKPGMVFCVDLIRRLIEAGKGGGCHSRADGISGLRSEICPEFLQPSADTLPKRGRGMWRDRRRMVGYIARQAPVSGSRSSGSVRGRQWSASGQVAA